jgi:hypothetical protein
MIMNEMVATNNMMQVDTKGFYSSMETATAADKVKLYNAQNSPDYRLKDETNMEIAVVGVIAEIVTLEKKDESGHPLVNDDGEIIMNDAPRVILFDADGKAHQCVSVGIFNSVKKIIGLFGEPQTWEGPLSVKVKNISKGTRSMLSLEVVGFKTKKTK